MIWDAESGDGGPIGFAGISTRSPTPASALTVAGSSPAGPLSAGLWRADENLIHTYIRKHRISHCGPGSPTITGSSPCRRDGTVRAWFCEICGGLDELVASGREAARADGSDAEAGGAPQILGRLSRRGEAAREHPVRRVRLPGVALAGGAPRRALVLRARAAVVRHPRPERDVLRGSRLIGHADRAPRARRHASAAGRCSFSSSSARASSTSSSRWRCTSCSSRSWRE